MLQCKTIPCCCEGGRLNTISLRALTLHSQLVTISTNEQLCLISIKFCICNELPEVTSHLMRLLFARFTVRIVHVLTQLVSSIAIELVLRSYLCTVCPSKLVYS